MKIALAVDGNEVSQHFGHCQGFYLVDIEENVVNDENYIKNPGHRPGFLPKFLAEIGVNAIVSGGMGQMAQQLFSEEGIQVITGARGNVYDVIGQFTAGNLESSNEVCEEHQHEGHCGE